MNERHVTRRGVLAVGVAGVGLMAGVRSILGADTGKPRFKISACDWSLGKRQQVAAFEVAKEIGIDGVQFSFDQVGGGV